MSGRHPGLAGSLGVIAIVAWTGCGTEEEGGGSARSALVGGPCSAHSDCLGDDPCTMAMCLDGTCRGHPIPGCCWAPEHDPATGLPWHSADLAQAHADSQCDTNDVCGFPTRCDLETNSCRTLIPWGIFCAADQECDDGDPCTRDTCRCGVCRREQEAGCCVSDGDCDDGLACTTDTCVLGACRTLIQPGAHCCLKDADCPDDGDACTGRKCVLDPVLGIRMCRHPLQPPCVVSIPFVEEFDGAATLAGMGWKVLDHGSDTSQNWSITGTGPLGPDPHARFTGDPATSLVKSVLASPVLESPASMATMTLQWRMVYGHSAPGRLVTLRAVAAKDGGLDSAAILWSRTADRDIEYGLFSTPIPAPPASSPTLRVGFMVWAESSVPVDSWRIDRVVVAPGVPNELLRVQLWRCDDPACSNMNQFPDTMVAETLGAFPDVTMTPDEHFRYQACYKDVDGGGYQYLGFPHADLDTEGPLDRPAFVSPVALNGLNSCSVHAVAVQVACGSPQARFLCQVDINPKNDASYVGVHRIGIRAFDHWDFSGGFKHSPLESLNEAVITVLPPPVRPMPPVLLERLGGPRPTVPPSWGPGRPGGKR